MATNVVDFKIKVDGKELDLTKTSLNQFKEVYSETQKKLNDLPLGSPEWKKLNTELKNADTAFQQTKDTLNETESKFKSLRLQIRQATIAFQEAEEKGDMEGMKKAKKNLDDLGDQLEITTLKAMKFEDALATMPGVAGLVGQSIQGVDKAFKVLVANPILAVITAVVGAFMFLKEALSKTSEGQAALNKVQQAFSKILGPILALINTVAVPIFETLAKIIEKVAGAFAFFAEKLGVSKESIAKATKDIDEVGKEAAKNETDRQEKAAAEAEKEAQRKKEAADKAKAAFEAEKKRQQDLIKSNEDLEQSQMELLRAKIKASEDPIQALKDEQKQKDQDYEREKARIEKLKKVKGTTAEEQKQLTVELNNLETQYLNDKTGRDTKLVEENKKKVKALMDDEIGALNIRNAKGELTEDQYQSQLYAIQKKYTTDKKELNDIEISNEQYKTNKKKELAEADRSTKLTALQDEMNKIDKLNQLFNTDLEADNERFKLKREKLAQAELLELQAVENNEIERNKIIQKYSDLRKGIDQQQLVSTQETERARVAVKQKALDDIISIAGAESAVGRAALVAKQILLARELVMEISRTITFSTQAAARSVVAVAEGTAQTAKIGFPQNIPMLIGYAAQAFGIISAIKSAVSAAKGSANASESSAAPAPTPNMGRNYEKGGMLNGPRHAQGGMMIEAEGGEAIMTRGAVTMFAPMLSAMNQMGGGTSFGNQLFIRPDAAAVERPQEAQAPVIMKTYVVSNDLTTESEKLARLKDLSTL
jgi:hypothetical protein